MLEACERAWTTRSFKREVAALAVAFWAVLTCKLFFFASPELIGALGTAYGTASTSIWLYAGAAFGLDAFAKQIQPAGA